MTNRERLVNISGADFIRLVELINKYGIERLPDESCKYCKHFVNGDCDVPDEDLDKGLCISDERLVERWLDSDDDVAWLERI